MKLKALAAYNLIDGDAFRLRLNAGPTYNFLLNVSDDDGNIEDWQDSFNSGSFNLDAGLGADIWYGARVMFCEGTIQPKLDLISQVLTKDLGRRFGRDVTIAFPDCSPRNQEQRRKDDELDASTGLRTFNEIRRSRGLRPYADAVFDSPMLPARRNDQAV